MNLGLTDCTNAPRKRRKRGSDDLSGNSTKYYESMEDFLPMLNTLPPLPNSEVKTEETTVESKLPLQSTFEHQTQEDTKTSSEQSSKLSNDKQLDLVNEQICTPQEEILFTGISNNSSLLDEDSHDLFPELTQDLTTTLQQQEFYTPQPVQSPQSTSKEVETTTSTEYDDFSDPSGPSWKALSKALVRLQSQSKSTEDDELVKKLFVAHLRQHQELRELRALVRHLQSIIIAQNIQNMQKQQQEQTHQLRQESTFYQLHIPEFQTQ